MSASGAIAPSSRGTDSTAPLPGRPTDGLLPANSIPFIRPRDAGREIGTASRTQANLERACKRDMRKANNPALQHAMNQFKKTQSDFLSSAQSAGDDILHQPAQTVATGVAQKYGEMLKAKSGLLLAAPQGGELRGKKMQKELTKMMRANCGINDSIIGVPRDKSNIPHFRSPKNFYKKSKVVSKNQKQMIRSLKNLLKNSQTVDGKKLTDDQKHSIRTAMRNLDAVQSDFMVALGSASMPDICQTHFSLDVAQKAVFEAAGRANVSLDGSKSGDSFWKLQQVSQSLFSSWENDKNNVWKQLGIGPSRLSTKVG